MLAYAAIVGWLGIGFILPEILVAVSQGKVKVSTLTNAVCAASCALIASAHYLS